MNNIESYIPTLVTLGLWYFYPTLLMKTERIIRRTISNAAFTAIEYYSYNKNEMIKDGYHVNYVYLEIDDASGRLRKIDVTSMFRNEILKGTFNKKGCTLLSFVRKCCKPNSNIQTTDDITAHYRLQVDYTFDYKSYIVTFDQREHNIVFPIYLESKLREYFMIPSIMSAVITKEPNDPDNGIDVTHEINKYAGPLANFYDDQDTINVLKKDVISNDFYLFIIDHCGRQYTIDKDAKYITLLSNNK